MKEILLKINDTVELHNGTTGIITSLDLTSYEVKISNVNSYPQWFHKINIKTLNGKEVDSQNLIM
jgi:hypothetical protein